MMPLPKREEQIKEEEMKVSKTLTRIKNRLLIFSGKAVSFAWKLNLKVFGIIENMSGMISPHCGKKIDVFKVGGGGRAALELGVPFLGKIPIDPQIVTLGDEGKPFVTARPDSEASQAFMKVVEKIIKAIDH